MVAFSSIAAAVLLKIPLLTPLVTGLARKEHSELACSMYKCFIKSFGNWRGPLVLRFGLRLLLRASLPSVTLSDRVRGAFDVTYAQYSEFL
ncbi:hypothetical protein NDU88_006056 [Pleurodeles waltl]|uniref:Secreted protein n=1 Tax=Pleurodeles waltl TaxID=8319 RepID=A0AAV7W9I6_PLEWA|nr:hypothetical protein NDU88_006056 [Pleurodeles waltl]